MRWESEATVQVARHDRIFEITVCGEIDYDECDLLRAAWAEADEAGLPTTLVDLSGVSFGDSQLLSALLDARQRHEADGRGLVIAGPLQENITRLFTVSGTLAHFRVADSRDRVLRANGP
ncbi:STAS domain-containing protein [Streptomyces sp. TG1A-8]|uniref:STAS domain-containing protein n=1 Tax=Streptomyces sp. TG1A-8 TaxID=3051385 RepID=UPI00265BAAAD|nr:STAS domain-containing protein [Streptomyces sp. TG1A-8]MDO0929285.1 STAS domain-containing protein [Streptomyces sp. TG1A-8]